MYVRAAHLLKRTLQHAYTYAPSHRAIFPAATERKREREWENRQFRAIERGLAPRALLLAPQLPRDIYTRARERLFLMPPPPPYRGRPRGAIRALPGENGGRARATNVIYHGPVVKGSLFLSLSLSRLPLFWRDYAEMGIYARVGRCAVFLFF